MTKRLDGNGRTCLRLYGIARRLRGSVTTQMTTDEILALIRGED
jgi:hypothetical protein